MTTALVVIDVQRGFVNDKSQHVVPKIIDLIHQAKAKHIPVFFTRFINDAESGYVRWMGWSRVMNPPEIELCPEIVPLADVVFDKPGYTSLVPEVRKWLAEKGIARLYCCGVDTDSCVLKTAVDAFESDIEPMVVHDACASHAGQAAHEAGLFILSRLIGQKQILSLVEFAEAQLP